MIKEEFILMNQSGCQCEIVSSKIILPIALIIGLCLVRPRCNFFVAQAKQCFGCPCSVEEEGMNFARLQLEFQSKGSLVDVEIKTLSV